MFIALLKKQMKILFRSPSEVFTLFVMPIVLILILSYALGSIMGGDSEMTTIEMAIIHHGDEQEQFRNVINDLPPNLVLDQQAIDNIENSLPVSLLFEELTTDKEMQNLIHVTQLEGKSLAEVKENGDYDVVVEIPQNFTKEFLQAKFFNQEKPAFNVYLNESEQITSTIVKDLVDYFQLQYTLQSELSENNIQINNTALPSAQINSTIRTVDSLEEVTSSVYYTFSMAVMFMLFVAGTLAGQSFIEKNTHIFDRILLARIHLGTYLLSIIVSSVVFTLLQVLVLFSFSYFVFHISFARWELFLLLTIVFSLVIGAIAALLSSINYRSNSAGASNLFSTAIVAILAFFGGSYFNISSLSPFLAKVGMWTPNGAALDGYLTIAQNGSLSDLLPNITILSFLAVLFMLLAFLLFPKRGGIV
ncbi:ABC transporter permease [Ureibacillus aquaedulcis]|uniref:ABC transporter permease n=1 Tax=Ureibacillus aquaedulcis TaxID=3058421 RepID=A0ABT8GQR5_9BACL|nr:ABC transporter permease [Ureibacillus sp. BA0131]MDN4493286.1 ABC transporter permease [Ureibacillus sp. BA0131]